MFFYGCLFFLCVSKCIREAGSAVSWSRTAWVNGKDLPVALAPNTTYRDFLVSVKKRNTWTDLLKERRYPCVSVLFRWDHHNWSKSIILHNPISFLISSEPSRLPSIHILKHAFTPVDPN